MDDALVGTTINRYKLLECINKTELIGYFKAYDTKLERNVIMKLVLHSADYSDEAVQYFLGESRVLAKLVHPNIAKVLDFGFHDGNLYLISEHNPGVTLASMIHGPMNWQRAVEILLPLTDALTYAHSRDVIHRDLKPENIIITDDGRLILNDFSLVKIIEAEETRDMTGTKVGLGSPEYISPEQGKGLPADFRSDIYSLGVIFYELVTGQRPFSQGSSMEIVIQHVTSEPPRPRSIVPALPAQIEKIILTALSKDVNKRYQTMEEFAAALQAVMPGAAADKAQKGTRSLERRNLVAVIISILGVLILMGVSLWEFTPIGDIFASSTPTATIIVSSPTAAPPTVISTPAPPTATLAPGGNPQPSPTPTDLIAGPTPTGQEPSRPGLIALDTATIARQEDTGVNVVAFVSIGAEKDMVATGTDVGLYFYASADLAPKYYLDTDGPVTTIAASDDNAIIATGDKNGVAAVWSLSDGAEIARFEGHVNALTSLEISPDKTKLASAANNLVYLWDINQKKQLFVFEQHTHPVNKVLFSRDGQYVISGGDDFKIMFWDVNSGKLAKQYPAGQKINDISLSADGVTMALALNNATIELMDYGTGQPKLTFEDIKIIDPYKFLDFSPNGSVFVSGSENGTARVWNVSGNLMWDTSQAENKITSCKSLAISSDGTKFVTLSNENQVSVWDQPQKSLQVAQNLANVSIPDTSVEREHKITVSLPPIPVIAGAEIPPASASLDSTNIKDVVELARWGAPEVSAISFVDNSHLLLAATSAGIYFYDSTDLALKHFFDAQGWLTAFSASEDGLWVGTGDETGQVAVWNIADGKEIARFQEPQANEILSIAISPDKTLVAAVGNNKLLSVWDIGTKQLKFSKRGHDLRVNKILFARDSQHVISGGDDFQLISWDVNNGEFTKTRAGKKINDISISADGTIIALALNNSTIEIWNYKDGSLYRPAFQDQEIVDAFTAIAFLPNNSILVSGSENGIARVWNVNGNIIWETPKQDKNGLAVATNLIKTIAVSDDGARFATLDSDNLLSVWDMDLKSLLVSKKLGFGSVQRMGISSDDKLLVYQAGTWSVEVWSLGDTKQLGSFTGTLPRGYPLSSNAETLVISKGDTLLSYSLQSTPPKLMYTLYTFPINGTVNYLLDDKIIAAATKGILKYWSVASGMELSTALIKNQGECRVFYRNDDQFLGAGTGNGILNTDQYLSYFCKIPRGPRTLSEDILPDGSIVVLSAENQNIEIWDARTNAKKKSIKTQTKGSLNDVAISSDGKLLAVASGSGIIEIYDLTSEQLVLVNTINAHNAAVTQVAFTHDLKYLLSASADGTVRFWGINH